MKANYLQQLKQERIERITHQPQQASPAIKTEISSMPMDSPPTSVKISYTGGTDSDFILTAELLERCLHGDTFICPWCSFTTQDIDVIVPHLGDCINEALRKIYTMSTPTTPTNKPPHANPTDGIC